MMALVILAVYGVLGLLVAAHTLLRGRGAAPGPALGHALLALALWPFLLPVLLAQGEPAPGPVKAAQSERARRLGDVTRRLEECWRHASAENVWATEQAREHRLLDGFVSRLHAQERRLLEMEQALAQAPASVKERLGRLHEHCATELEHSIGLVEELAAQLTLLRFSGAGTPSDVRVERVHIEELLLRIEALAEASQPGVLESPAAPLVARA